MFKGTPVISSPFLKLQFLLVVERSLNAPSRSLMDAKSHIGAVVVPLRQVCWNAPVCNLKLSLAEGCVCVSQCETTQPFKTITSRKRQVHLTSPCHGHGGNTGDRHNRRNNHKQRICGFSSPSSHSSAGKRSSRTVHRHEGRARGRGKKYKNAVDYNQSGTTEFALGGAESIGPILGRLIPLSCCICERLIHQCMWMTFELHMENTSTSPRRGSMKRRRKSVLFRFFVIIIKFCSIKHVFFSTNQETRAFPGVKKKKKKKTSEKQLTDA